MIPITLPRLRDRIDEIPDFVEEFFYPGSLFRSSSVRDETTGDFSAAYTQCFTENAGLQLQITI